VSGINYNRYEFVSYSLERKAYAQQMKGRSTALKHFLPCNKALVFTAAMGKASIPPSSVVIIEASLTPCVCHPNFGYQELDRLYGEAIKAFPNVSNGGPQ
jgi:hypothetical protein